MSRDTVIHRIESCWTVQDIMKEKRQRRKEEGALEEGVLAPDIDCC